MDELTLICSDVAAQAYEAGLNEGQRLYEPKWISVKERKPELHGAYIVKWETRGKWACMWLKKDGVWQFDQSDVTHWMEFPEDPKDS